MASTPDVLVVCGGLPVPAEPCGDLLRLDVNAPEGDPARVNLNLANITRPMVEDVPERLTDLLEIACYVYCADQFTRRDTPAMQRMGAAWRRPFRFRIPVRDLAFWRRAEVGEALVE